MHCTIVIAIKNYTDVTRDIRFVVAINRTDSEGDRDPFIARLLYERSPGRGFLSRAKLVPTPDFLQQFEVIKLCISNYFISHLVGCSLARRLKCV